MARGVFEMEKRESSIDIFVGSILYPLSNGGALLVGGLVTVLYFFYIGIPFILGYQVRCGRAVLSGDETLPDWGDIGSLLKDGILALVIAIVYGFILVSVGVLLYIPLILASLTFKGNVLAVVSLAIIALLLVILIPICLMLYASLMIFIETADLSRAINPMNAFRVLKEGPLEFVKAFGVQSVASFVLSIPLLVFYLIVFMSYSIEKNMICCTGLLFFIVLPWLTFPLMPMMIYVFAKYYQRVTGAGLSDAAVG